MRIYSLSNNISSKIDLSGSKSISNRLLILNNLFENKIKISNLSNSKDTQILNFALKTNNYEINISHAGTAMRFLTSYFSYQKKEKILTGSKRMKERPIGILVNALRSMGANIKYLENEGFPPLKIIPSNFEKNEVLINAHKSSQFITSLLLIGSKLNSGLKIKLIGKVTSNSYLNMTINILNQIGINIEKKEKEIIIKPKNNIREQKFIVESDWSSVSYYYSIAAASKFCQLEISSFFSQSLQGDSKISKIYKNFFGVYTEFKNSKIFLSKIQNFNFPKNIKLDLNDCPDIAQTIALTSSILEIPTLLTGLETLKIKETDRIVALQNELNKCGVETIITNSTLEIKRFNKINYIPKIQTYNDHRMAMAFTPLALKYPIEILDEIVVEKSYPNFWNDMNNLGIKKY